MRNFVSAAACAALLLGVAACDSTRPAGTGPSRELSDGSRAYLGGRNLPSHGVALEGYCPVAYFAVDRPVRGRPQYASTHDGVTYWFASEDAKAAFDKDPEKYVPAYGGWCAYGMAVQNKFPIDPESFQIVDGRLHLFLKNSRVDARALWNQGDAAELTERARQHWDTVRN